MVELNYIVIIGVIALGLGRFLLRGLGITSNAKAEELPFALGLGVGMPALRFYPDNGEIPGILKYSANEGALEEYKLCRAPWTNVRVAPNGDVYPCLAYRMGNSCQQGLLEIWRGKGLDQFRAELATELLPACMGCCFLGAKPGITYQASRTCVKTALVAG